MDKEMREREAFEHYRIGNVDPYCTWEGWQAACKWQRESMQDDGMRQCAKGQHTSQFCGQLESAVAAERAVSDRLLEALLNMKRDTWHWQQIRDAAIAEVESMRKEKPE